MPALDLADVVNNGELIVYSDETDDSDDEDYVAGTGQSQETKKLMQQLRVRNVDDETHVTSKLFETVIMRKHATLSTCIQRLYLTLTSGEPYVAIADVLSFVCECAGFRQSSIKPELLESFDKPKGSRGEAGLNKGKAALSDDDNLNEGDPSAQKNGVNRRKGKLRKPSPLSISSYSDNGDTEEAARRESRNGGKNLARGGVDSMDEDGERSGFSSSHKPIPEISYDVFDWWYFRNTFASLPTEAVLSDIIEQSKTFMDPYKFDKDDSVILPDVKELLKNKQPKCIATKFTQLCMDRVKHMNTALEAQDGWTIGFGRRNSAFLRFKEFFQQLVLDAESKYLGELLFLLQWVLALSLNGFRAIRQFAHITCVEMVSSLMVKLEMLTKQKRVFSKQLQVEIELDQRTHERIHGKGSHLSSKVSKSTLELYKKLLLAQRGQVSIVRFLKCIYNVNVASKLRDVLVDIRITTIFSLSEYVLLNPIIFSDHHYLDLAYRLLPASDEVSRLLLLRFISLVDTKLTAEHLGILVVLHESCCDLGLTECCNIIESILLKDLHQSYEGSVVRKHCNEKGFLSIVKTLEKGTNHTLSVLISSVFLPSVQIDGFSLVFLIKTDDLPSKYRNMLIPHPEVAGQKKLINISDSSKGTMDFTKCISELAKLLTQLNPQVSFTGNLISSIWKYSKAFSDVEDTIRLLCQGGDVTSLDARLDEERQKLLLYIAIASVERSTDNSGEISDKQKEAVKSVISYAPILLRLYKANQTHARAALQLISMATLLFSKAKIPLDKTVVTSLADTIIHLMETDSNSESSIDCMRLAVRCMYNLYSFSEETKKNVKRIYNMALPQLENEGDAMIITLHCVLNMLHYFPLELEMRSETIDAISRKIEANENTDRMLWCALGYVLYEAEIYKCIKKSQQLDPELSKFGGSLLGSLAAHVNTAVDDFQFFAGFCSMVSLVQISSLVNALEDIPEGVEQEMYNILHHFLVLAYTGSSKIPTSNATSPVYLENNKKGITVADVFITGHNNTNFVLNPLESVLCLIGLFTKVLFPRLYCSGVSVLILLQLTSSFSPIASAAGVYLRFLVNYDPHISSSLMLYDLIGLYESNSRELLHELCERFIDSILSKNSNIAVDPKKTNIDQMIVAGVQYALQCPSNWEFLDTMIELLRFFMNSGGIVNGTFMRTHIGQLISNSEPPMDVLEKLWHILNIIGMSQDDVGKKSASSRKDPDGVNRCLNIIRRLAKYVDFSELTKVTTTKKQQQTPSSTCIVKRKRNAVTAQVTSEDYHSEYNTSESGMLEVSPIVVRTFTKSHFKELPPSIGMKNANSPSSTQLSLDLSQISADIQTLDYRDMAEFSQETSRPGDSAQYSSSYDLTSPSLRFSPF
ncbi:hypothetical protein BgAZ_302970 [Babesia gibsoni]|uniref:STAG domain-containing protein n=1 Tax=Babesia gibsoni TaxID=33632 RepID=A0AAD8LL31_BABGI|nr:hypothetical protein BgAZ_302970 [Babesia gibsoni]